MIGVWHTLCESRPTATKPDFHVVMLPASKMYDASVTQGSSGIRRLIACQLGIALRLASSAARAMARASLTVGRDVLPTPTGQQ